MTDWITTLYERYLQLFGDPESPPDESTVSPSDRAPAATSPLANAAGRGPSQ